MCRPHYNHCNLAKLLGVATKKVLQIYKQIVYFLVVEHSELDRK